jgi:Uncharacterized conserved protein (COG2071)
LTLGSREGPRRPFLTARWANVALLSYPVPDAVLTSRLPPGLALDRWQGRAFVSLVAFDFQDTRVRGVGWPGFTRFPEVNLRFYVREGDRRGVVFVRELIPSRVVSLVARLVYNEPYRAVPLRSVTTTSHDRIRIVHEFAWEGRSQRITVEGRRPPEPAVEMGATHFFKEHAGGTAPIGGDARCATRSTIPSGGYIPTRRLEWSSTSERCTARGGASSPVRRPSTCVLRKGRR